MILYRQADDRRLWTVYYHVEQLLVEKTDMMRSLHRWCIYHELRSANFGVGLHNAVDLERHSEHWKLHDPKIRLV